MLTLSVAFSFVFALGTMPTLANHSQCSDGIDNDNDSKTDYPQDDDCTDLDDDFEGIGLSGNFVTITDDRDSVQPGQAVVYRITLKQQRVEARNVNVFIHLPHQANVVSASDGGSFSGDKVTWTNVSVYKNVTRVLTINVNIDPDASVGQYLVTRALVEGEEATDTTLVENYVAPVQSEYDVSITDGEEFAFPGDLLNYTVRVRNTSNTTKKTDVRVAMPYITTFQSASDNGVQDSFNVSWRNVTFQPNESKTFRFTTKLDYRVTDRFVIRARAYAGTISNIDQTVVRIGLPYNSISTTLTDNRSTAEVGQTLNYVLKVTNNSDTVGTNVSVDGGFPIYGQFLSATDGGWSDGNNVRWLIVQLAPHETRTLGFSLRVRQDAPLGAVLMASAVADGATGVISRDSTTVALNSNETGTPASSTVIFRKNADRAEAIPGGSIRYTLFVRNTLDHVIDDAKIIDRFDDQYLTLASYENPQNLAESSPGHMTWNVPVLQPGETWSTTYVLDVSLDAPTGVSLDNVATLQGSDVNELSLTQRVSTNTSGVLRDIPTTGAGMDALMGLIVAGLALAATGTHRKFAFGTL